MKTKTNVVYLASILLASAAFTVACDDAAETTTEEVAGSGGSGGAGMGGSAGGGKAGTGGTAGKGGAAGKSGAAGKGGSSGKGGSAGSSTGCGSTTCGPGTHCVAGTTCQINNCNGACDGDPQLKCNPKTDKCEVKGGAGGAAGTGGTAGNGGTGGSNEAGTTGNGGSGTSGASGSGGSAGSGEAGSPQAGNGGSGGNGLPCNGACGPKTECVNNTCVPAACGGGCPSGQTCNVSTDECEGGAAGSGGSIGGCPPEGCGQGQSCVNNMCVPAGNSCQDANVTFDVSMPCYEYFTYRSGAILPPPDSSTGGVCETGSHCFSPVVGSDFGLMWVPPGTSVVFTPKAGVSYANYTFVCDSTHNQNNPPSGVDAFNYINAPGWNPAQVNLGPGPLVSMTGTCAGANSTWFAVH